MKMDRKTEDTIVRYSNQVVLKTMNWVRNNMRGSDRIKFKQTVSNTDREKSEDNLTKGIDRAAEDLLISSILNKFKKLDIVKNNVFSFTIYSEELGIKTYPESTAPNETDLLIFIDPIDGTEFVETLQAGWCLLTIYDQRVDRFITSVAGDIFLNRLYWASDSGVAECIDFTTHSWFKLDGGLNPKSTLEGARINVLTTKVERYRSLAQHEKLLSELAAGQGRINLAGGSSTIIQVAAGYADVAVEFCKGFALYDILVGYHIGLKSGLTILDLEGNLIEKTLNRELIVSSLTDDLEQSQLRIKFVAAQNADLAHRVIELIHANA